LGGFVGSASVGNAVSHTYLPTPLMSVSVTFPV